MTAECIYWPVERRPGAPCAGCGSGKLPDSSYCTVCDASGIDDILALVPRHELPKTYQPDKLAGGRGAKKGGKKGRRQAKAGARAG